MVSYLSGWLYFPRDGILIPWESAVILAMISFLAALSTSESVNEFTLTITETKGMTRQLIETG